MWARGGILVVAVTLRDACALHVCGWRGRAQLVLLRTAHTMRYAGLVDTIFAPSAGQNVRQSHIDGILPLIAGGIDLG